MGSIRHYYFNDDLKSQNHKVLGFEAQEILARTQWSLMEILRKELKKKWSIFLKFSYLSLKITKQISEELPQMKMLQRWKGWKIRQESWLKARRQNLILMQGEVAPVTEVIKYQHILCKVCGINVCEGKQKAETTFSHLVLFLKKNEPNRLREAPFVLDTTN